MLIRLPKLANSSVFPEFTDFEEMEITDATGTEFNHRGALEYAESIGKRLLTKEEVHYLIAAGTLSAGDRTFWSSSEYYGDKNYSWSFLGSAGCVARSNKGQHYAVRCVGRIMSDNINKLGGIIAEMTQQGFKLECGPHVDVPGFYAAFYKIGQIKECEFCLEADVSWDDACHESTIADAIVGAYYGAKESEK